jgi:hypothetical protein
MSFKLPFGVEVLNPVPTDTRRGPYSHATETGAKALAVAGVPAGVRGQGQQVDLIVAGVSSVYVWANGIADGDLVPLETPLPQTLGPSDSPTFAGITINGGNPTILRRSSTGSGGAGSGVLVDTYAGNGSVIEVLNLRATNGDAGEDNFNQINFLSQTPTPGAGNTAWNVTIQGKNQTLAALSDINNTTVNTAIGYTPEDQSNKATDLSSNNNTKYPTTKAVNDGIAVEASARVSNDAATLSSAKAYADSLMISVYKDCGNWDASGGSFPTTGGTGTAGAIKKGNAFEVSVAGTMGGEAFDVGDIFRAVVDAPGQTLANWARSEHNTQQATETNRGTTKIVDQTTIQTETSTDDQAVVTTKKFWFGISRLLAIAQTINGNWNFTGTLKQLGNDVLTAIGLNALTSVDVANSTVRFEGSKVNIKNDQSGTNWFNLISSKEANTSLRALVLAYNNAGVAGITESGDFKIYDYASGNDVIILKNDGTAQFNGSVSGVTESVSENSIKMASTAFVQAVLAANCSIQVAKQHLVSQTALATITSFTPAADADLEINAVVDITTPITMSSGSFTVIAKYTDPFGTVTYKALMRNIGLTTVSVSLNGVAAGQQPLADITIRAKGGTTVYIMTESNANYPTPSGSTMTAGQYDISAHVLQLPS